MTLIVSKGWDWLENLLFGNFMASFTEDHLVEQPAFQLMHHELEWEDEGILNVGCRILNGRGKREKTQ